MWALSQPMNIQFQVLLFKRFFSEAMLGDPSEKEWNINILLAVRQMKTMSSVLLADSLLYLAGESDRATMKLPGASGAAKESYQLKILAIKAVLDQF